MVFVRLSLDWSDAQPYQGEATELRSLVIALTALAIGFGGTLFAAVRWWKSRDRSGRLRR